MDNEERIAQLRGYVPILRGLISYHERMFLALSGASCKEDCKKLIDGKCPKDIFANDIYLGALKEGLRLIEREIAGDGVCQQITSEND
jgi:hypothetical protein